MAKREMDGYCSECGLECTGKSVDFGIGPYEYWGQKGNNTQIEWVSSCCEATITDEEKNVIDPPEPDYDEPERDPDLEKEYADRIEG